MILVDTDQATPVSDRVAQRATELRGSLKLTRTGVVAAMADAGVTTTVASLRNFEDRRRREIGVDELVALAAALGASPAELLDDVVDFGGTVRRAQPADDLTLELEGWLPGVRRAVHEDIADFGDLIGVEPSLAQVAYVLAEAIDNPATEPRVLPSLIKELRQVLDALRNGRPGSGGDDDDLDDLDSPD